MRALAIVAAALLLFASSSAAGVASLERARRLAAAASSGSTCAAGGSSGIYGSDLTQIVGAFGSLWVIGSAVERHDQGAVLRIDPATGKVIAAIRASRAYGSLIGATATAIWVGGADVYPQGHSDRAGVSGWWGVARISDTGRLLFHAAFAGAGWSMARGAGAVWVALPWSGTPHERRQDPAHEAHRLLRIATTGSGTKVRPIELEHQPGGLAAAGGLVWMGGFDGLSRVGPTTVVPVPLDVHPTAMVASPGVLWAAELTARRLTEVSC